MAPKLTDLERQQIIEQFSTGKSCNAIARDTGRSTSTVSNIAREEGHRFGQSNLAQARAARSAYGAETRARIAAKLAERMETAAVDDERWVGLEPKDWRDIGQGMSSMARVLLDIDRHDNAGGRDVSAMDQWLAAMTGTE